MNKFNRFLAFGISAAIIAGCNTGTVNPSTEFVALQGFTAPGFTGNPNDDCHIHFGDRVTVGDKVVIPTGGSGDRVVGRRISTHDCSGIVTGKLSNYLTESVTPAPTIDPFVPIEAETQP